MISATREFTRLIDHRLEENQKSFGILYELKHYGNCISILCQELDQVIRVLFILKSKAFERDQFIESTINSQKWFRMGAERKKEFVTEETIHGFAKSLEGWERGIYEFASSFKSLSNNYNYMLKDPMAGMKDAERGKIRDYIRDYHGRELAADFGLNDIIPFLPQIFEKISQNLRGYMAGMEA